MVGSKTSPGPPRASKKMLSRTPSDSPRPVLMMQQVLGDESPAAERRALVLTEVSDKMVVFGDVFLVSIRCSLFHYGTVTGHRNYGKYPRLN